jgi:hypothetical protein
VRRSALAGLLAFAAFLPLFFGIGGLRLWPRIAGQRLPLSLIWPFARPLLAAALELAFLLSIPIALGLAGSGRWARPPTTRSRRDTQRETAWATGVLVVGLGTFSFGLSSWLDGRGSSPGQLASELVASARDSCIESEPAAEVPIPMLGFAWVCRAGRAPSLQGRAPLGKHATFQAKTIDLGEDLKRITLGGFTLTFPLASFRVEVRAQRATLSGLPPWGRSRRMPPGVRVCLFALSAALAAFGVGRLVLLHPGLPVWAGGLLGAPAAGSLWWALAWLERQEPHVATYLALPVAGIVGAAASALTLLGVLRFGPPRWRPIRAPEAADKDQ